MNHNVNVLAGSEQVIDLIVRYEQHQWVEPMNNNTVHVVTSIN